MLRYIGRLLTILTHEEQHFLRRSVLLVDNDYASYEHLRLAIEQARARISPTQMSVLALSGRQEFLRSSFPELEIILPSEGGWFKKYRLAIEMARLKKRDFDYVVLLSLDKTPIIAALFFMNIGTHVLLYNQWKQWYAVRMRNIWEFITAKRGADRVQFNQDRNILIRLLLFIPMLIVNFLLFIYLLIYAILAFLGRICHILKFGFKQKDSL